MPFERIAHLYIKGATLGGMCLDSLHSKEIDREALKGWVNHFAEALNPTDPSAKPIEPSFRQYFLHELLGFCLYVASTDGELSDKEIAAIDWLLEERYRVDANQYDPYYSVKLNRNIATASLKDMRETGWIDAFPSTFKVIVRLIGDPDDPDGHLEAAAEVSRFYYQVARYVYAVDNDGDLEDNKEAYAYVSAFDKYVERVSAIDFRIPDDEETIEDVLDSWDRLARESHDKQLGNVPGHWVPFRGNAFFRGGLSDLTFSPDGTGYMLVKKLFGSKRVSLSWKVQEVANAEHLVITIPSMGVGMLGSLIDNNGDGNYNRAMLFVKRADNPRLNGTMGMYLHR